MTTSLLQGKQFFCRDWIFSKVFRCLENANSTARSYGMIIMGGPGCGKTALCCEMVWPTLLEGRQAVLSRRILGYYFCQAHNIETLSVTNFIHCLVNQISKCSLIHGYAEMISDPAIQNMLYPQQCEIDPDEVFRAAVMVPLSSISPPSESLFILVDSLDESYLQPVYERSVGSSHTIAELLANHHHILPSWLLFVCTARRQSKSVTRLFAGFRKIGLDDLRKSHVVRDVQQYILCRLDREDHLRQHLNRETAEMLNQLHIKSNGCFLYLERVLDGVVDNFILLQEIRDIPGTLNGLYLWLCQRLFPKKLFSRVQPILNVIFAARQPLAEKELYDCVLTRDTALTLNEFHHNMGLLSKILIDGYGGTKIIFHQSFAEWLLDVKYCTQKYLCVPAQGHAMLALSFTLRASTLTPVEVHKFTLHLVRSGIETALEPFHMPLWLMMSGANTEDCLFTEFTKDQAVVDLLLKAGAKLPIDEALVSSITGMSSSGNLDEDNASFFREDSLPEELDSSGRTALCNAAFQGNLSQVLSLISKGADLEVVDSSGQTALCHAARHGHTEIVSALLSAGASVNHADHEGWTALRSSAWGGHSDVVNLLLDARAEVDRADNDGRTALRAAAWGGHDDIVLKLLEHGACVNSVDKEGRTALIATSYMGHSKIVQHLLQYNASVNHEDIDGRTALSVAALCIPTSRTLLDVISLLIENGAEVDHEDKDGMTPLVVAAYEGHPEICELLLENDANVDHCDHLDRSPLDAAVSMGNSAVVRSLLFWGAGVDRIDAEGRSVLCCAAQQGNAEVVQQLLDRGLDELHRDNCGWTPLHIAAYEGNKEVVEILLEAGAQLKEFDNDGRIPLVLGALEGHLPVVAVLIEAGSPIESKGHDGRTALRVAALEGHVDVVQYLLCNDANVDYKDIDGRTTLYALALDNQVSAAKILLDYGANADLCDLDARTPLHIAAWQGYLEMVRALLSHGANPNSVDKDIRTPIQFAAWQGHAIVVEVLLENGATVEHESSEGATALGIAVQEGHEEVVGVLLRYGANPNHADKFGRTPVKIAVNGGHASVLKMLQSGAGPEVHALLPKAGKPLDLQANCEQLATMCNHVGIDQGQCNRNATATTSGVSSMETKYSSSTANAFSNGQLIMTSSPNSTSGKRKSLMSNNSSKSSSVRAVGTNTLSTNQSSSSGEGQTGPLTFTQELQQCSVPRHKNRSLNRLLSPVNEPSTPKKTGAKMSKSATKSNVEFSRADSSSHCSSTPSLPDDSSESKCVLPVSAGAAGASEGPPKERRPENNESVVNEVVWQRRFEQSQMKMNATNHDSTGTATAASTPAVLTSSHSKRSTIVTNPNYSLAKSRSSSDRTGRDTAASASDKMNSVRPTELRFKRETPL